MLIFWIKVRKTYLDLSFQADKSRRNWTWRYPYFNWNRSFVLKPRPNDCNISTQHIATLLGATCCVRLATLLWRVATCWVLLPFRQVHVKPMLRLGMRISSIFNSQHVATRYNRVVKRVEHVALNNVAICQNEKKSVLRKVFSIRKVNKYSLLREKVL